MIVESDKQIILVKLEQKELGLKLVGVEPYVWIVMMRRVKWEIAYRVKWEICFESEGKIVFYQILLIKVRKISISFQTLKEVSALTLNLRRG